MDPNPKNISATLYPSPFAPRHIVAKACNRSGSNTHSYSAQFSTLRMSKLLRVMTTQIIVSITLQKVPSKARFWFTGFRTKYRAVASTAELCPPPVTNYTVLKRCALVRCTEICDGDPGLIKSAVSIPQLDFAGHCQSNPCYERFRDQRDRKVAGTSPRTV